MPATTIIQLLEDGSLELDVENACLPAIARWLPRSPFGLPASPTACRATIRLRSATPERAPTPPAGKPSLLLSTVSAWIGDETETAHLHGGRAGSHGSVDLNSRVAHLLVPDLESEARNDEAFTMLTISAALLLGRLRRPLVHAAGAIAPHGGCWLLIGDTHAGKTTTTINLVRGGWGFLSDDHVVAGMTEDGLQIEGWPRPFHVDEGWKDGRVTGVRTAIDPADFGTKRWLRSAPLAGLLFPRVRPDEPTRLESIAPANALSLLIRQTPWLMTDRGSAPDLLDLLGKTAALPGYQLSVGRDSYADSEVLLRQLEGLRP